MRKSMPLVIVAILAAGHGAVAVGGALFMEDVTLMLRLSSFLSGAFLLVGAGLLLRQWRWSVLLLWLSAMVYFLSIVLPAFARHGSGAFSVLMNAFYWSVGFRVFLAIAAHLALKHAAAMANTAVNPDLPSASRLP
jgi:peptidoglycan/LPS O-acetylase OafA/YrhL